MKKIIWISIFIVSSSLILSCKKAGLGGEATLVAYPKHHEVPIYGATVYVKFNTKDSPGSDLGSYDAVFQGEANEDHVHLEELKQGNYYIYAVGYDSAISQAVYGGKSVTIKRKDRKDEQNIDISVTE
jgi:hypothetical protein